MAESKSSYPTIPRYIVPLNLSSYNSFLLLNFCNSEKLRTYKSASHEHIPCYSDCEKRKKEVIHVMEESDKRYSIPLP